jgi:hypothetical protein
MKLLFGLLFCFFNLGACGGDKADDAKDDTQKHSSETDSGDSRDTGTAPVVCTGVDEDGAVFACVSVDWADTQAMSPRLVGYNFNPSHHGIAPWDDRLVQLMRTQVAGNIRYPGAGYTNNWRTGLVEQDWAMRFEPDVSCETNTDCVDPGRTCEPQPTAADPDAKQCQRPCAADTECDSDEICLFGQCATSCSADPAICDSEFVTLNLGGTEKTQAVKRECYRADTNSYGCLGEKFAKYLSFNKTLLGKGYYTPGDLIRLAEITGARMVLHANSTTDSVASLGEFAEHLIEQKVDIGLWGLANETFYFRTQVPPTLWTTGTAHLQSQRPYIDVLNAAYGAAGLATPPIAISFSDAETSWQRAWDWGLDEQVDRTGTGSDNKPGIADDIWANGRPFTALDYHWYPGNGTSSLEEAEALIHVDLPEKTTQMIDDYFLPLACADEGGVCSSETDPEVVITEFNIQTTWSTTLAAVHMAEFILRNTRHPRVSLLGYHSLTDGCMDTRLNHRINAQTAGKYNRFGSFDSNAKNPDGSPGVVFGEVITLSCLALELVNGVVNTSAFLYGTQTEVGDEEQSDMRLYAQAYQGESHEHLLLTNRSDQVHRVSWLGLGEGMASVGMVRMLAGEQPEYRNCAGGELTIQEDEVCPPNGDIALSEPVEWLVNTPLDVPPWSVVRVDLPRVPSSLPAPSELSALAGPRSASISWAPVNGATSYDIRYGVTPGHHPFRQTLDASACGDACEMELENLAHEVPHELTVTALNGAERGETASTSFTPARMDLATGNWGAGIGPATWTSSSDTVDVGYAAGISFLPMVNADGSQPDWETVAFEAEFRLDCTCDSSSSSTACEKLGLAARFVDSTRHVKVALDSDSEGCFFRIGRRHMPDGLSPINEVFARSAYIGIPIVHADGRVESNEDGTPVFPMIPAIDDGEWHKLRITTEQQVIRLWLDGRMITAGLDPYVGSDGKPESGTVALTANKQEVSWRNFSVWQSAW